MLANLALLVYDMKNLLVLLVSIIVSNASVRAQQKPGIAGTYSLQGVMEIASGVKLNEDSTFQFYFSYGALDRVGSGTWKLVDSNIILNSTTIHDKDFKLLDSGVTNTNKTTIRIKDKNPFFYKFVYCRLETPTGDTILKADDNGIIKLPSKPGKIELLFELCPEKISAFNINKTFANVYTFQFEPWITEVFFKNFQIKLTEKGLEGKHPLLSERDYVFAKDNAEEEINK